MRSRRTKNGTDSRDGLQAEAASGGVNQDPELQPDPIPTASWSVGQRRCVLGMKPAPQERAGRWKGGEGSRQGRLAGVGRARERVSREGSGKTRGTTDDRVQAHSSLAPVWTPGSHPESERKALGSSLSLEVDLG